MDGSRLTRPVAQPVMTDQVGVRLGLATGLQICLTCTAAALRLPGSMAVAVLLVATLLLASTLDGLHALVLGAAGWAFATGFMINTLGLLTTGPWDLVRLVTFVAGAFVGSRPRTSA